MRSSLPRWTESTPSPSGHRAEQLVERRLRREPLGDGDDAKVMRRLVGMLARRGYSQGMAVGVVTDALAVARERRKV